MHSVTRRAVIFPDNFTALALCRSLGPKGVPVDVLAVGAASPGQYSRYASGLRCPDPERAEEKFIEFLAGLVPRNEAQPVLFCADDKAILLFEKYRSVLEKFFLFSFPPWECVRKLLLKDVLYLHGLDGVPTPVTVHLLAEEDLDCIHHVMDFPALLKPTLRCLREGGETGSPPFEKVFGAKAVRVRNKEELAGRFQEVRDQRFSVLVQEEIPGGVERLYTLGIYAGRDGQIKAAWTGRKLAQVPSDFGDALVVEADWRPELLSLGERIVRATGFYGIADIEFKHDPRDGKYKLLDINPRPWPWIGFPTLCGVNLPYVAYRDLIGLETPVFRQTDRKIRWASLRGLISYAVKRWHAGALSVRDLFHLVSLCCGAKIAAPFSLRDPLPRLFLQPAYWKEGLQQLYGQAAQ